MRKRWRLTWRAAVRLTDEALEVLERGGRVEVLRWRKEPRKWRLRWREAVKVV